MQDGGSFPTRRSSDLVNGVDTGVVTDGNGDYSFSAGPGTYTLQELLQAGWRSAVDKADLQSRSHSGGSASGNEIGNFKNITISGHKFEDHNGNHMQDG